MSHEPPNPVTLKADPPEIPDHALLRVVGRGAYGEVWLARSLTGTFRAVKVVYRKTFSHERPFEREFLGIQKFEPISRSHPGLVSVLHVGRNVAGGYFYYVMEVADDAALGQRIEPAPYQPRTLGNRSGQAPLPLAECLRIGVALSAALAHLHKHGLIHRDIKPSNIIFVDGAPKFADIGLVTDIGENVTFVGTEGFIPPEGPGSPSADLYALGMVLYETGLGKSAREFPELPDDFRSRPHTARLLRLNDIIMKACDPQAKRRFQSADEMRAALDGLLRELSTEQRAGDGQAGGSAAAKQVRHLTVLVAPGDDTGARLARLLEEQFSGKGLDVFVDAAADFSLEWGRMIETEIRSTDAVVALLSPVAARSELMAYALEVASQPLPQRKTAGKLLPVLVQCSGQLPQRIQVALPSQPPLKWNGADDDARLLGEMGQALGLAG